jgi:spore germination protein KB
MLTPYVKQRKKIKKAFLQGTLLGGIVISITILVCLLVLGPSQTGRTLYPTYSLARMISIGGFFERVEAMLAFMWLLTIFIKITLYFYIFTLGLSQVLNLKEYRMLTFPTAILLILFSSIIAPNATYYKTVIFNYWPFFDFTYGLVLPFLMLGAYYIRKKTSSQLN